MRLYRRKAHLHHYLDYIEQSMFDEAVESLDHIVAEYDKLSRARPPATNTRRHRLHPLI